MCHTLSSRTRRRALSKSPKYRRRILNYVHLLPINFSIRIQQPFEVEELSRTLKRICNVALDLQCYVAGMEDYEIHSNSSDSMCTFDIRLRCDSWSGELCTARKKLA